VAVVGDRVVAAAGLALAQLRPLLRGWIRARHPGPDRSQRQRDHPDTQPDDHQHAPEPDARPHPARWNATRLNAAWLDAARLDAARAHPDRCGAG